MSIHQGPSLPLSEEIHAMKYRGDGESFREAMSRVADALSDTPEHFEAFREILLDMRFLPAGRVQNAMGAPIQTTPYNCFVAPTIPDSMDGIMDVASYAAETMRRGGGIGYDFSTLRPRGEMIASVNSKATGPVSFMRIFDAVCGTIATAGHRRGAQMGVLRVDHPDIEEFISAKNNSDNLTNFNVSVGITDDFMMAVEEGDTFPLRFDGKIYRYVDAEALWNKIMRSTWDWAEPGVLFIDRMNKKNNLWYCETIAATNPCGEQPLPPHGACLLGSFNLTKYIKWDEVWAFDHSQFQKDIHVVVRAMDNVVDRASYPTDEQRHEALSKRRMGLGVTGLANAIEATGAGYGTEKFLQQMSWILGTLRDQAYLASTKLSAEKGPFPAYSDLLLQSGFAMTLPHYVRSEIEKHGLRNSHLLSFAPTGTISLTADNVSSGIEPVFQTQYSRTIQTFDGPREDIVMDYGMRVFGTQPTTADQLTPSQHVAVLNTASKFTDSACSKTCNIGPEVSFDEFKQVYLEAYYGGSSGCTTFRSSGKRFGILNAAADEEDVQVPEDTDDNQLDLFEDEGGACYFDPETGQKSCE